MGTAVESAPTTQQVLRASSLRRPLCIQSRGCRLSVDPDGGVRSLHSMTEERAIFGYEQVRFYKVQAGIVVQAQRPDWGVRFGPQSAHFTGKVFDSVEVVQLLEYYSGKSIGYFRRLRLRNGGAAPLKLRILCLRDPTAAHFGDSYRGWGSLGLNAFNRDSHVAMDEVSDPPAARVVGSAPSPSRFYLTTSGARAQEALSRGDLPEATAGMSGQVIVISSHDVELAAGEVKEVTFASMYDPGKLEDVLSEFGRLETIGKGAPPSRLFAATSDGLVTDAAAWAQVAVQGGAYSDDPLDRYEALRGLAYLDPPEAARIIDGAKRVTRKDGSLPHSLDPSKPGILETAVYLRALSTFLLLSQDKKLRRSAYPSVRKLATFLLSASKESSVRADPSLPQGWRRHLGRGYPTGEIPEVSLALAGGLGWASQVARALARSGDAAKFRERSEMVAERVRKKLVDERGLLALCSDTSGRLRGDETVDMAVAAFRHPFMPSAEQATAHRLLERDFDTPYGPRCVPTTNQVYFNGSYGRGQLGGVWTRAALAYALVCYRAGLTGLGSIALGKVARLVAADSARLGGSPGEFPQWVDVEGREAHSEESDPVAAARFVESLVEGEMGLEPGAEVFLSPPALSSLGWVLLTGFWAGERASAFLGRGGGKPHLFFAGGRLDSKRGSKFSKWEPLDVQARGVHGVTFFSPGQVLCLGNSSPSPSRFTATFAPRAAELAKRLSTPLEEYDPAGGTWTKTGSLRVFGTMSFEASLGPNEWKAFRVSTA
jgi:hypothetical protein